MKRAIFLICLIWTTTTQGQINKIQWASNLEYQFNQYDDLDYSGNQVLGIPDAFPPGTLNPKAFRLKSEKEFGNIKLGFDRPHPVQQIIIVENHNPGKIVEVKLLDTFGFSHIIYQNNPKNIPDKFRTLVLSLPKTQFSVKSIEIKLNTIYTPGICQIDAVGIMEDANLADVREILSGANYNIQREMTFPAQKELMASNINSRYSEAKPLVSHDGNTLYFSRLFHPDNTGGNMDPQDIYYATFEKGSWSNAHNMGQPLNDSYANGVCSISPDGNALLLINGYESDGSLSQGVSISRKTALGWGKPQKLKIDDFENHGEFLDFYLSADEEVLLMSANRRDGIGEQDLYLSRKTGWNAYSKPISLGKTINTTRAEFAPFLSPDNKTLYFASEGHKGYGQSDIFCTRRLDDSWQEWTTPQNLGPAINSSSWDAYFSVTAAGDFAYFVSSDDSPNGDKNIYKIPLLQEIIPEEQVPMMLSLKGKILDARTKEPLSAEIILESDKIRKTMLATSDLEGIYLFTIPEEDNYRFKVSAPGYFARRDVIELKDPEQGRSITYNVFLEPVRPDQLLKVDNLMFERSKSILLAESFPALKELAEILSDNPGIKIELAGHTDALGSKDAKMALSIDRVEVIKKYLVGYGIDQNRIRTVGYGGTHPVAPNDTEDNRARNRRVEIRVTDVNLDPTLFSQCMR